MKTILAKFSLILAFSGYLFAQATFPTTTLATALTGWPAAHQPALSIFLASNAAIVPGQNPVSTSGIGDPSGHTAQILMIGTEAVCVNGPIQPNGSIPVERGCQGTYGEAHSKGATVWVGFPSYYAITPPYGYCNAPTLPVLPTIYLNTGVVYNCVASRWVSIGNASMAPQSSGPIWHAHPVKKVVRAAWYRRFWQWIGDRTK